MTVAQSRAHDRVKYALATGKLVRLPCESCGRAPARAHHDDYLKPLEVRWLCQRCHLAWHRANGPGLNTDAFAAPKLGFARPPLLRSTVKVERKWSGRPGSKKHRKGGFVSKSGEVPGRFELPNGGFADVIVLRKRSACTCDLAAIGDLP